MHRCSPRSNIYPLSADFLRFALKYFFISIDIVQFAQCCALSAGENLVFLQLFQCISLENASIFPYQAVIFRLLCNFFLAKLHMDVYNSDIAVLKAVSQNKEEKKMKRMLSIVLCLTLMLTLAACGGSGSSTKMTMGTGGTSGTYYAFGGVLGQYIKNNAGIDVTVVSTDGSKANIESIYY